MISFRYIYYGYVWRVRLTNGLGFYMCFFYFYNWYVEMKVNGCNRGLLGVDFGYEDVFFVMLRS